MNPGVTVLKLQTTVWLSLLVKGQNRNSLTMKRQTDNTTPGVTDEDSSSEMLQYDTSSPLECFTALKGFKFYVIY